MLYFEHLHGEYRGQPAASIDPEVKGIAGALLAKKRETALTWDDLYTFDLMLARLAPPEKLRRKVWSLSSRYRDIAGLRECEAYLAWKPPDPEGHVEEVILRAAIEYLLGQPYLRYAIMPVRERERSWVSSWVVGDIGGAGCVAVSDSLPFGRCARAIRARAETANDVAVSASSHAPRVHLSFICRALFRAFSGSPGRGRRSPSYHPRGRGRLGESRPEPPQEAVRRRWSSLPRARWFWS